MKEWKEARKKGKATSHHTTNHCQCLRSVPCEKYSTAKRDIGRCSWCNSSNNKTNEKMMLQLTFFHYMLLTFYLENREQHSLNKMLLQDGLDMLIPASGLNYVNLDDGAVGLIG